VRPTIALACVPIATGSRVRFSIATQEGSLITMPFPRINIRVLAVPKSMPISRENNPKNQLSGENANLNLL
jgi:hypothetical protein